ncbi:MAG: SRPBCC family protein [Planctomycetes bacterium]|nr:SRPBCC family protein [Planctomycetota bacterium]
MAQFVRSCRVAAPRAALFAWHARPRVFARLTPPWERVRVVVDEGGIEDGARKVLRVGPLGLEWVARHEGYERDRRFVDVQERGPFRAWRHEHRFQDDGPDASILEDAIEYELPLGAVGALFGGALVRRKLARMFEHRHRVTVHDVELAHRAPAGTLAFDVRPRPGADARRTELVAAFLSGVGWDARVVSEHADRARGRLALHVLPHGVEADDGERSMACGVSDASDESLASIHRALLAFERARS